MGPILGGRLLKSDQEGASEFVLWTSKFDTDVRSGILGFRGS